MATMIGNPDSIRKLRNDLLDTVEGLQEQLKKTEAAMDEVANEWKDIQFKKYNEEFTKDKEMIPPLCNDIEEFEDEVLRKLEEILRRYEEL